MSFYWVIGKKYIQETTYKICDIGERLNLTLRIKYPLRNSKNILVYILNDFKIYTSIFL